MCEGDRDSWHHSPFTHMSLGIDEQERRVYLLKADANDPEAAGSVIHELGHLHATRRESVSNANEYGWMAWEIAVAREARARQAWDAAMKDYGLATRRADRAPRADGGVHVQGSSNLRSPSHRRGAGAAGAHEESSRPVSTDVAKIGMLVEFTRNDHPHVPLGMTGVIDVVNDEANVFWVLVDNGGFYGWTSFDSWKWSGGMLARTEETRGWYEMREELAQQKARS
jgi:hypothetical protein